MRKYAINQLDRQQAREASRALPMDHDKGSLVVVMCLCALSGALTASLISAVLAWLL